MRVRNATEQDMGAILEMGRAFYETTEYAHRGIPYDHDSAELLGNLLLDSGILLVAEEDGDLVGMVGLVVAPFAFNFCFRGAHEVMWWVSPSARSSGAGLALLRAVDAACREAGVHWQEMKNLETSPGHVAKLYERFGYTHSESSYTKSRMN